jgi:two-component system LytT family sensor kinase
MMESGERYERARQQVKALKSFYAHVITYVGVMIVLFFVDYSDHGGTWWFYWPLIGWGIAVAMHAFETFGKRWERRKIKKLMDEEEMHEQ